MEIITKWNVAGVFFSSLDIVLRLTVKTDGQSGQTVLVLAPFEKPKHSAVETP